MQRVFLMFLMIGAFIACDDAAQTKMPDDTAVADTDTVVAACGDGTVAEDEVCEPGDTADCTEVTVGYSGTATCYEDCSGWDMSDCVDTDECADEPGICGDASYASCENTEGAYVCTCANGYVPTSDDKLCVPKYDFEGSTYNGDLLLIVNEDADGNNQAFIGTMPETLLMKSVPATASVEEPPTRPAFRDRVIPLPAHATPDRRLGVNRFIEPEPDPVVGDRKYFWAYNFNTGDRYESEAEAVYVGEKCIMWAQLPVRVSTYAAQDIGKEFDNTIYGLITETFYEASDVDQNGKITIFFLDAGGNAGGYFSSYELYDFEDSNRTDMIYIEEMTAQWGDYAVGIIAHEFTHLVHNNRDELVEELPQMNTWVMEGMSTSGEHVYGGFQSDYKSTYNSNDSIANGMSVTYWEYTSQDIIGNYALTYLFHQYLRIHSGQGTALYREIIESEYNDDRDYDAVIQKYIDPELDTAKMLTNFRIALVANEATGLYGFKKESGFSGIARRYWPGAGGNDFYLRGGGALQIGIDGSFKAPNDSDGGIRYIGIWSGKKATVTADEYKGE